MTDKIMEMYESANKRTPRPDLACMEESTFYAMLKSMGVSLEWARKNCNITITDGIVWITPPRREGQREKTNEHLGIH